MHSHLKQHGGTRAFAMGHKSVSSVFHLALLWLDDYSNQGGFAKPMMHTRMPGSAAVIIFVLAFGACGKSEDKSPGPAEKAGATMGKAIDQAADKAGQVMEKAGEALKEAGDKAKEMAKDAADKMKDKK
jgi:hypothetical protein